MSEKPINDHRSNTDSGSNAKIRMQHMSQDNEYRDIDPGSEVKLQYKPSERRRRSSSKKKKKNTSIAIIAVACVLLMLSGTVAVAAATGFFGGSKTTEEPSIVELPQLPSVPEVSEETGPVKPTYAPTGEFKSDLNKFSADVRQSLTDNISSRYVVLYDVTADKILFQKNGTEKLYPASTTKIMTAIVSSQIMDKDDVIVVGDEIKLINWDSSTAGLVKGMKLTYEMLLDALMLPSGNDAAYTIAVNSARKYADDPTLSNEDAVKLFMELVNEALKEIGCTDSHYVTPDGWHDDDHYTTATDLAKMGAYAKTIDIVRKCMAKYSVSYELLNVYDESSSEPESSAVSSSPSSATSDASDASAASDGNSTSSEAESEEEENEEEEEFKIPEEYDPDFFGTTIGWYNTNALINPDSEYYSKYSDGIKTGFTDEAGTCVVSSATIEGHTMIASVMMGYSTYGKYEDANRLFEEAFKLYGLKFTYGPQGEE